MKAEEIILYKAPRKSDAPTLIDGQVFCTAEQREELYAICERLSNTGRKLVELTKSAAMDYFRMGEWLYRRLLDFPRCTSARDLQKALPGELHLSYETVCKALKIYKHFMERPELLQDFTLRECLKLIADGKPKEEKPKYKSYEQYEEDEENQLEFDPDEFFSLPTLSGVELENTRFATQDNELFVVRRGFVHPERIAVVYADVPEDVELQTAYNRMMANFQRETEKYFALVEAKNRTN